MTVAVAISTVPATMVPNTVSSMVVVVVGVVVVVDDDDNDRGRFREWESDLLLLEDTNCVTGCNDG